LAKHTALLSMHKVGLVLSLVTLCFQALIGDMFLKRSQPISY